MSRTCPRFLSQVGNTALSSGSTAGAAAGAELGSRRRDRGHLAGVPGMLRLELGQELGDLGAGGH